jgi:hypothetical protein
VDSSVCLKSALERRKKKGNITEEIKLIFLHFITFLLFSLSPLQRQDETFFISPITQCTKHDSLLKRRPSFTSHIAMQSVKQVAFCSGTVNSLERDAQCDGDAKCLASY